MARLKSHLGNERLVMTNYIWVLMTNYTGPISEMSGNEQLYLSAPQLLCRLKRCSVVFLSDLKMRCVSGRGGKTCCLWLRLKKKESRLLFLKFLMWLQAGLLEMCKSFLLSIDVCIFSESLEKNLNSKVSKFPQEVYENIGSKKAVLEQGTSPK